MTASHEVVRKLERCQHCGKRIFAARCEGSIRRMSDDATIR